MSLLSRIAVEAARGFGLFAKKGGVSASYLVVAGGGGGGVGSSGGLTFGTGGGGAGGLLTSTATLSNTTTYTIVVGSGGVYDANGANSSISGTGLTTITATGGGAGSNGGAAGNGGSGGGGISDLYTGGTYSYPGTAGGTGTSGQGYAGGTGIGFTIGGGGGGASAVGNTGSQGKGGNGSASSISGSSVTYAGGGGGGRAGTGSGGTGGGGDGGANGVDANGSNGTINLGGGGGGCSVIGGGSQTGGSGGSGIVIISYPSSTPLFVGGTITTSGGKQIHTFTSSGTLSPITPITASYLVVAGGGAGGALKNGFIVGGGGGGAGGLLTSSTTLYSGATYVVTVGAGGAGVSAGTSGSGSNSVVSGTGLTTITATGGGGGGWNDSASGIAGGSGGGGANGGSGGAGTSGQGSNGGGSSSSGGSGGGGGASAVGSNGSSVNGGNGGAGTSSSISGSAIIYAGGGGGGGDPSSGGTSGTGGAGGGGNAGATANSFGVPGTSNLGGGGGGCGGSSTATAKAGGNGGSGIVIISYAGSQVFNGGLVTSSGGNTIHTFTSTGALTPLTNNLNNSLRFRRSVTASLTRTPTVAGNRRTFTWSAWVKRGVLDSHQFLLSAATSTAFCAVDLLSNNMRVNFGNGTYLLVTTQVFRDPSAWYHIVLAVDTTQATDANRVRLFVNGNQVTAFSTAVYPIQNYDTAYNNTVAQRIGVNDASDSFDGYMTDINFIDGQALEPYYFGNNDANGVWKPILYKGTYGTNGFYLTFGNTTSTTTLGYDSSPNGNNWTCNNISLTAGVTYDAMTDVPTNTSATVANYCTWNPLYKITGTVSNGNLTLSGSDLEIWGTMAFPTSGSYYYELTVGTTGGGGFGPQIGITSFDGNYTVKYFRNGYKGVNGTNTAYGGAWAVNDVIGIAYNASTNTVTFYKNNVSQGDITATSGQIYAPYAFDNASGIGSANFGQRPFSYTPPTGFVALNTYNLPTPTILQGNKYMDATLYTQNGAASNVVVNAGQFKPDLVWIKCRTTAGTWNNLVDSVRGGSKTLYSNATNAEGTDNFINTFNSNGFTLNIGDSGTNNTAGRTQVAWNWQAGQGTTSSNTSGTITSTVSVNTTAGFSIVTWTATGSNATIGHGLGVAPKMIITKGRNAVNGWNVYTSTTGNGNYLRLDTTAASTSGSTYWNNTSPTSTVFSTGTWYSNTETYVAYCWAEVSGYSKFGSYTGNGSTDGPFVFLGFRPKFVMVKEYTQAGDYWMILDTSRDTYNIASAQIYPNASSAESSTGTLDMLSNGFKLRYTGGYGNNSGQSYIYMAFAEAPFKISNSR